MAFSVHSNITRSANYKWWAFLAIEIGTFTSVMDQGSVIVALPTIADHFETDLPTAQWVMVVYALTISALLLPMGRLSDLVGRKQVYISGFAVFVLGAVLAGLSTDVKILIAARLIQGVGSAMTQGTGLAIVTSAFPGSERGKVMGLYLSVVGMGSIAGSPLGGFLVDALSWRWVFYTTVGTATVATLAPLMILDGRRIAEDGLRSRFDWPGAALSTGTLLAFLMAMTNGPRVGWTSPYVVVAGGPLRGPPCHLYLVGASHTLPNARLEAFQGKAVLPGSCGGVPLLRGVHPCTFPDAFLSSERSWNTARPKSG